MGWPRGATPNRVSEGILQAEFQNSMAQMVIGNAETGGIAGDFVATRKVQFEVAVSVRERQQTMIQEVKCRKTELKSLVFGYPEVLQQGNITVPERRTGHIGQPTGAEATVRRRRKAIRIRKLIVLEP